MMKSFVILLLAFAVPVTASLTVQTPSCSGGISVTSFKADCGDNDCTKGSDVEVTGTLTSKSSFDTETRITVEGCVYWMGVSWYCQDLLDDNENLCDWVTPQSGDCGDAGTYDIEKNFKIPGDDGGDWFSGNMKLNIKVEDVTSCTVLINSASFMRSNACMVSVSMVGMTIMVASFYCVQRSRKVRTTQDGKHTPLVELSDLPRLEAIA